MMRPAPASGRHRLRYVLAGVCVRSLGGYCREHTGGVFFVPLCGILSATALWVWDVHGWKDRKGERQWEHTGKPHEGVGDGFRKHGGEEEGRGRARPVAPVAARQPSRSMVVCMLRTPSR
jgi:hypothetical protein